MSILELVALIKRYYSNIVLQINNMENQMINKIKNTRNLNNNLEAQVISMGNVDNLIAVMNGIPCGDNNDSMDNGIINLKSTLEGLTELKIGFKISFKANFTMSATAMKNNQRYELINLAFNDTESVTHPVLRAPFTLDSNYPDGMKDNRPTFISDNVYILVFNGEAWISDDGLPSGSIIHSMENSYTPAGFKDLSYNYDGIDFNQYKFLGNYDPKSTSTTGLGTTKIASLPKHTHTTSQVGSTENINIGTGAPVAVIAGTSGTQETTTTSSQNISLVTIGTELYPSFYAVRTLQKL